MTANVCVVQPAASGLSVCVCLSLSVCHAELSAARAKLFHKPVHETDADQKDVEGQATGVCC